MSNQLTIVVPVLGNQDFTLRFLKYFNTQKFKYKLIIADGGKGKLTEKVTAEIKKNPKIQYFSFYKKGKGKSLFNRYKYLIKFIKTPYVKLMANDDFFLDTTIAKCIKFLNNNKKFSIAGGSLINFRLKNKISGKFYSLETIYDLKNNSSNNILKRLSQYMSTTHSTFHCVYRSSFFKKSVNHIYKKFDKDLDFKELFFEIVNTINSKQKFFKEPISFHQVHERSEGTKRSENILDQISKSSFIDNLKYLDYEINKIVKSHKKIEFFNIYFKVFLASEIKKHKSKAYFGARDIMKLTNRLIKIKFKNNYEDNVKIFIKKFKNSKIINEIYQIKNYLIDY